MRAAGDGTFALDGMSYVIDEPLTPHQVRCLLDELCIDLGFCLPPADIARLMDEHPLDARKFADEVYRIEGMEPGTSDIGLWRQVRDRVRAHFERAT